MAARKKGLVWLLLSLLTWLVGCDVSSGYAKKDGAWIYGGKRQFVPLDPASFRPLDTLFARDAQRGYYCGSVIEDSEGKSFEVLSEHEARDARAVYYADTYRKGQEYWTVQHIKTHVIAGADPASYRVLEHSYARDAGHAFYEGLAFKVRDPASFEPLNPRFARDAQRGYYERIEIPGSHGASFALLDIRDSEFARDRAQVYHGHIDTTEPNQQVPVLRVLRGADAATIRIVGRGYVADAKGLWFRSQPVAGADLASFKINADNAGDVDATDAAHSYRQGVQVTVTAKAPGP